MQSDPFSRGMMTRSPVLKPASTTLRPSPMRWIRKSREPSQLTRWRARYKNDPNFDYDLLRISTDVIAAIEASLLSEQGWLCAYTGCRIEDGTFHIEHIFPQDHCTKLEAVTYRNMLACFPRPNWGHKAPYGADQKGNWPTK